MVRIYVNGERVTKEDLSKIEIRSEEIKKILIENLLSKAAEDKKVAGT